jgi:hypothetical protein
MCFLFCFLALFESLYEYWFNPPSSSTTVITFRFLFNVLAKCPFLSPHVCKYLAGLGKYFRRSGRMQLIPCIPCISSSDKLRYFPSYIPSVVNLIKVYEIEMGGSNKEMGSRNSVVLDLIFSLCKVIPTVPIVVIVNYLDLIE